MQPNTALKIISPEAATRSEAILEINDFHVWIEGSHILDSINLTIQKNCITCIIGPSGSGKSTLIRSLNRIDDASEGFTLQGTIQFKSTDIHTKGVDLEELRRNIGMVFQKPCVFPKSIKENVLFGIRRLQKLSKAAALRIVEDNLRAVSLWEEVTHRLDASADSLSLGQQQRLCLARTLAVRPQVLLLDEPTSSLDPTSTRAIENLMLRLKSNYPIVFVTHNLKQAKRIADRVAFMCKGRIVEEGLKEKLFSQPHKTQTRNYLSEELCEC